MISILKKLLGNRTSLSKKISKTALAEEVESWINNGQPSPPPHLVKQSVIIDAKKTSNYKVLIETGTYLGQMVEAQKSNFEKIYSIELGEQLYIDAVKKFENDKHITILYGDSGKVLKDLMPRINEPAVFWLDGHYSAGITAMGDKQCPIYEELSAIFSNKPFNHFLLIDDARLFVGKDDYPTLEELSAFIKMHKPSTEIYVKHDAIHVLIKE